MFDNLIKTDSAGDCNKARRLLQVKYRGTFCASACAAHTLDRLLEDIGKLKRFANSIATLRVIAEMYTALRLTDSNNPSSGEIFPRMCKLTESLRVNEFVTAKERTFALGLDGHRKITTTVA